MGCPSNDLILDGTAQFDKVGAVTRYPNDQVSVFFWMQLSLSQFLCADHVALNVMAVEQEKALEERDGLVRGLLGAKDGGIEFDVEERATGLIMIDGGR